MDLRRIDAHLGRRDVDGRRLDVDHRRRRVNLVADGRRLDVDLDVRRVDDDRRRVPGGQHARLHHVQAALEVAHDSTGNATQRLFAFRVFFFQRVWASGVVRLDEHKVAQRHAVLLHQLILALLGGEDVLDVHAVLHGNVGDGRDASLDRHETGLHILKRVHPLPAPANEKMLFELLDLRRRKSQRAISPRLGDGLRGDTDGDPLLEHPVHHALDEPVLHHDPLLTLFQNSGADRREVHALKVVGERVVRHAQCRADAAQGRLDELAELVVRILRVVGLEAGAWWEYAELTRRCRCVRHLAILTVGEDVRLLAGEEAHLGGTDARGDDRRLTVASQVVEATHGGVRPRVAARLLRVGRQEGVDDVGGWHALGLADRFGSVGRRQILEDVIRHGLAEVIDLDAHDHAIDSAVARTVHLPIEALDVEHLQLHPVGATPATTVDADEDLAVARQSGYRRAHHGPEAHLAGDVALSRLGPLGPMRLDRRGGEVVHLARRLHRPRLQGHALPDDVCRNHAQEALEVLVVFGHLPRTTAQQAQVVAQLLVDGGVGGLPGCGQAIGAGRLEAAEHPRPLRRATKYSGDALTECRHLQPHEYLVLGQAAGSSTLDRLLGAHIGAVAVTQQ